MNVCSHQSLMPTFSTSISGYKIFVVPTYVTIWANKFGMDFFGCENYASVDSFSAIKSGGEMQFGGRFTINVFWNFFKWSSPSPKGLQRVKNFFFQITLVLSFEAIVQPLVHTLFIALFFKFLKHCARNETHSSILVYININ